MLFLELTIIELSSVLHPLSTLVAHNSTHEKDEKFAAPEKTFGGDHHLLRGTLTLNPSPRGATYK